MFWSTNQPIQGQKLSIASQFTFAQVNRAARIHMIYMSALFASYSVLAEHTHCLLCVLNFWCHQCSLRLASEVPFSASAPQRILWQHTWSKNFCGKLCILRYYCHCVFCLQISRGRRETRHCRHPPRSVWRHCSAWILVTDPTHKVKLPGVVSAMCLQCVHVVCVSACTVDLWISYIWTLYIFANKKSTCKVYGILIHGYYLHVHYAYMYVRVFRTVTF